MNAFHVSVCRWMLTALVIFGVLRRSESFSFTRNPANPTVVVEGVNSTQVELVWNFTATASFGIVIKRGRLDGSQQIQIASLAVSAPTFIIPDNFKADYEANLPATLVIKNATRNDEYKYTISVINTGFVEELFDEVTVDVLFPAKLTNVSHDRTVREGSDIHLFCKASGEPIPKITWTRVLADGRNSEVLTQGPTLDFPNINATASGIHVFICEAYNGFGTPDGHRVQVNVTYPAKIIKVTASEDEVVVQQSVSLQCKAQGNPPPSYRWTPCEPPQSMCKSSILNISEVLNDGLYTCTVRNAIDSDAGNVTVFIAGNLINVTLTITNETCSNGKYNQSLLWTKLNETMDKLFANKSGYNGAQLKNVRCGSVVVDLELKFNSTIREREVVDILRNAAKNNLFGTFQVNASSITGTRHITMPGKTTTTVPTSPTSSSKSETTWIIVGAVLGSLVVLAVVVAVIAWCMHKKRKCNRKDTKEVHSSESQEQGTVANPPSVTYDTVETRKGQREVIKDTPTVSYAVVDKSRQKKKEKKPKPGELQYAELAEFNPRSQSMPRSSASYGQGNPTETQYADVNAM